MYTMTCIIIKFKIYIAGQSRHVWTYPLSPSRKGHFVCAAPAYDRLHAKSAS